MGMAFISIVLLDLAFVAFELMVVFGMVALGVLGFVLCVVCLILWNKKRKGNGKRRILFLVAAIAGAMLALLGAAILAAFVLQFF